MNSPSLDPGRLVKGVLYIPAVGDRGSNAGSRAPSGVLSTMMGVRVISVDGDRGSMGRCF